MKKKSRLILFTVGLICGLLFYVTASAGITGSSALIKRSLSEPMNLLLIGVGFIGFGSYLKRKVEKK